MKPLPFFYTTAITPGATQVSLDEDTSKHIVQVLRMQNGERLQLTDGKGNLYTTSITDAHKKHCTVSIEHSEIQQRVTGNVSIAISPVKNNSRFEWFLEKATEIGVSAIIPLLCHRTEKQHFRLDRMKTILISAMLQSQQAWLPILHEPVKYRSFIAGATQAKKYIAHCIDNDTKVLLTGQPISQPAGHLICIGPEGDFTPEEIDMALANDFIPVSLGETRLRTETAGMVAAALLVNLSGR